MELEYVARSLCGHLSEQESADAEMPRRTIEELLSLSPDARQHCFAAVSVLSCGETRPLLIETRPDSPTCHCGAP